MAITRIGSLDLPVPVPASGEPVSDPALSVMGAFLEAVLNARGCDAWASVAPPAGSLVPVKEVRTYDPEALGLDDADLPALYLFRSEGWSSQQGADYPLLRDTIVAQWVFPQDNDAAQRARAPFASAISKLAFGALFVGRDPAWVLEGDSDPLAATEGSDLWRAAGLWRLDHVWWHPHNFVADGGSGAKTYRAVRVKILIEERVVEGAFDPLTKGRVDISLATSPPYRTNELELER